MRTQTAVLILIIATPYVILTAIALYMHGSSFKGWIPALTMLVELVIVFILLINIKPKQDGKENLHDRERSPLL